MYNTVKSWVSDPLLRTILRIGWPVGIVLGVFRFTLLFEMRGGTVSIDSEVVQSPTSSTALQEILEALSMSDLWVSLMFIHEVLLGVFVVHATCLVVVAAAAFFGKARKPKWLPVFATAVAVVAVSFAAKCGADFHLANALLLGNTPFEAG